MMLDAGTNRLAASQDAFVQEGSFNRRKKSSFKEERAEDDVNK